jgi:oligopeptide/dipeptide ABC transporter ATP-binding protein
MSSESAARPETTPLLEVRDLRVDFPIRSALLRRRIGSTSAVNGVGFSLGTGETLGLVGESGSGKSTTALALLRLIPITSGQVLFRGVDLTAFSPRQMRGHRREIQVVLQNPAAAMDPRMTVGDILAEPLRIHRIGAPNGHRDRVAELLELVGLHPDHARRYPHEFSGGQQQRIAIARALAIEPSLLILDEPVSALDVSIQAQVINLLDDLQDEFDLTYVFIAHDLGVVHHVSDRIAVMYLGVVVEVGPSDELFLHPVHPYTEALLSAIPAIEGEQEEVRRERIVLEGEVPSPVAPPTGCRFHTRCRYATEICSVERPPLLDHGGGRFAACHHPLDAKGDPR